MFKTLEIHSQIQQSLESRFHPSRTVAAVGCHHDSSSWAEGLVLRVWRLGTGLTLVPGDGCAGKSSPDWRLGEAQPHLNQAVRRLVRTLSVQGKHK